MNSLYLETTEKQYNVFVKVNLIHFVGYLSLVKGSFIERNIHCRIELRV